MNPEEDYLEFLKSKVGDSTLNLFKKYNLAMDLIRVLPINKLVDLGIDEHTVKQVKKQLEEKKIKITTGLDLMKETHPSRSLTSGVDSLDDIIRGFKKMTYEIFGESNSGKTQLCHQLSVTVQLPPENGGFDKKAIFIDNEGSFSPTRIQEISFEFTENLSWKKSYDEVLRDIQVYKPVDENDFLLLLHHLIDILLRDQIGIILVDSISSHFRYLQAKRTTKGQDIFRECLGELGIINRTFNIPVVVTNQLKNFNDTNLDRFESLGGNDMHHFANVRILLRRYRNSINARVIKSPETDQRDTYFYIHENGMLSDSKEAE